ncbi:hypothetical protein HK098_006821 [Nowakowskiella sp. JEL0407]|nr:hypothetical protein HK098_006821 [Nowakowskiella sp. JEL0407]
MDARSFQKIHPHEFLARLLTAHSRHDGRLPTDARPPALAVSTIHTARASSTVRCGNTTVVCGIKAEIAVPLLSAPDCGFLVPNVDLPALCSSKFKPGPPSELAQTISEYINKIIHRSRVVPLESLCIASGQAVWVLYADIVCLNYDGNALDAALIALLAALRNTRIPVATYDANESVVRASDTESTPLQINRLPISSTFGFFDGTILSDPSDEEEGLVSSQVTVVLDETQTMCGIYKAGGDAVSKEQLQECIDQAKRRVPVVIAAIKQAPNKKN